MPTIAPFLRTRYAGYLHREVPAEDAELAHVGPDTACGVRGGGIVGHGAVAWGCCVAA
jgi:hypothetical protein